MARVIVIMNNGRRKVMDSTYARALIHCKKAVYAESYEKKIIESNTLNTKSGTEVKNPTPEKLVEIVVEVKGDEVASSPEAIAVVKAIEEKVKEQTQEDELTIARKEYQVKFNKKAYHGWSVEQIKEKLS